MARIRDRIWPLDITRAGDPDITLVLKELNEGDGYDYF